MGSEPAGLIRSSRRLPRLVGPFLVAAGVAACGTETVGDPLSAAVGEPLPGLGADQLTRFEDGRASFLRQFTPQDGLGPRFNENSCEACHTFPTAGGTGETVVTKATRPDTDGGCDLLSTQGGENVRLRVTPQAAALGAQRLAAPVEATHRARFIIPFLYGMGLVEAVPQETLAELADPDDDDGDGISGRLGRDAAGRPARFGRKADQATLADFVDGALRLEMGVTTPAHPSEADAGSIPSVPEGADLAPDPEVDTAELQATVTFLRLLAPPSPAVAPDNHRAAIEQGRALFSSLGCASCHVPTLRAGQSDISVITGQTVALYSDLLLHDMGPDLEGTCAPGATTTEWRTEPLMGLRYRRLFLHDGRAGRVIDAVLAHGGESRESRDRFAALDRLTQESLLRFLDTL